MAVLLSVAFWLDVINVLFPLIIALAALYTYFTIDKDSDKLLLGLGFLFLVFAGLTPHIFNESITDFLNDEEVITYQSIFNFIGFVIIFIMVKPWEIVKELIKKE